MLYHKYYAVFVHIKMHEIKCYQKYLIIMYIPNYVESLNLVF